MLAPSHIVLLGLVILLALVVFGPKRLPELGQGVGRAIQEFKHASSQAAQEFNTTSAELKGAISLAPLATPAGSQGAVPAQSAAPVIVQDVLPAPADHSATN
ncbi:MAG: twin-arginine translocase TatA/TatE family subunit [Candidatus Dormibacteraeota bacterium]|jgi:sec-independent protein translocase protein TatA|nr:twin-arginine translocase TatA/TatE family subunit [Candidatus Dormibacteraeota bacterium]